MSGTGGGGSFGGITGGSNEGGGTTGVNNNLNSLEVPTTSSTGNGGRDFLADIHHDLAAIELRELGGGSGGAAGSRQTPPGALRTRSGHYLNSILSTFHIGVKKCVFNKRTIEVCVSCC